MNISRYIFLFVIFTFVCKNSVACGKTAHLKDYAQAGSDVSFVLQDLINHYNTIVIDEGEWLLSSDIKLRSGVTIKGEGAERTVLKRNGNSPLRSGMMFYTEKVYTDSYTKYNVNDEYNKNRIKYKNIRIENITIDFNRPPALLSIQSLGGCNLNGIALIRTKDSMVKGCLFKDAMTKECNNGYPSIVIYQSDKIDVLNNESRNVTFVQVIYSKDINVSGNHSVSSVGTAIEYIGGMDHHCLANRVDEVWWKVSCIGVNSKRCIVKGNTVKSSESNVSCLTLGHEPVFSSADYTIVEDNTFHSKGCRSIIIQNGFSIVLRNNNCSCIINSDAPELTSGCIVASGLFEGIHDIKIEGNTLIATGDGNKGCITYRGSGLVEINGNDITARRGISILSAENCNVKILNNTVRCYDYSISSNSPSLCIANNVLGDGIITNSANLEIRNNRIKHTTHHSFLGRKWMKVRIENNIIEKGVGGKVQEYGFLLDGSEKTVDYDIRQVVVINNEVNDGGVKQFIAFSEANRLPLLRTIRNIVK